MGRYKILKENCSEEVVGHSMEQQDWPFPTCLMPAGLAKAPLGWEAYHAWLLLKPHLFLVCILQEKLPAGNPASCEYRFGRVSGHTAGAGCGDPERASCTLKNGRGAHKYLWHQICFCLSAAVPEGWSIMRPQPVLPSSHQSALVNLEGKHWWHFLWNKKHYEIAGTMPPSWQGWDFKAQARAVVLLKPRGKYTPSSCTSSIYRCYKGFSILDIAFNTDEHKKTPKLKDVTDLSFHNLSIYQSINLLILFLLHCNH